MNRKMTRFALAGNSGSRAASGFTGAAPAGELVSPASARAPKPQPVRASHSRRVRGKDIAETSFDQFTYRKSAEANNTWNSAAHAAFASSDRLARKRAATCR